MADEKDALREPQSTNSATAPAADLCLVAAVLRKDRKATAELVGTYADAVYSYVRRRLLPRTEDVDDVVQDVFLAALESLAGFRGTSSLRSWILGVARHKVEDHYRERLRDAKLTQLDEQLDGAPVLMVQHDEHLDRVRMEDKIRQVLAGLPEAYRVALLWRYWEKRSAREMAAQTGRTEKAIERLLARAREHFQQGWGRG